MPASNTSPADGVQTVASGQVLNQRHLIFGTNLLFSCSNWRDDFDLRNETATLVSNLSHIYISLFLYPRYNQGAFWYAARDYIAWRPVFLMPPDSAFATPNLLWGLDGAGVNAQVWVPALSPQLLPISTPINFKLNVGGYSMVAIEIDTSGGTPTDNQGIDRIIVSISAGI